MGIILKSFKLQKCRHKVDGNSWPSDVGESKINVTNIDELLLYQLQLLHLNRFTVLVHQTGRMWTSNCQSAPYETPSLAHGAQAVLFWLSSDCAAEPSTSWTGRPLRLSSGPCLRSARLLYPPASTNTCQSAVPECLSSHMSSVPSPLPVPTCFSLGWQQACFSQLTFPGLCLLSMGRAAGCTLCRHSPLSLRAA